MKRKLSLFVFVDAMGWELLLRHPSFLQGLTSSKKKLNTILGYSNACDPSIITGLRPSDHGHWNFYYLSGKPSPFQSLWWMKYLPSLVTQPRRVRNRLSRWLAEQLGFTGYFHLYDTPLELLPEFDYAEKDSIWVPGGMAPQRSIFDHMYENKIPYFVDDSGRGDSFQFEQVERLIDAEKIEMAYLMLGRLDGLMHECGTRNNKVDLLMLEYDSRIRSLVQLAYEHYEEVALYVFSDHGMHNVTQTYDIQSQIEQLGLVCGRDYLVYYDSTMARFWFFNGLARAFIEEKLASLGVGRLLSPEELQSFGVFFPDQRYGEAIYLMNPGSLIVPSFMGRKPIRGMHGYHPHDPDSAAAILSNRPLPDSLSHIEHIFQLMLTELGSREKQELLGV